MPWGIYTTSLTLAWFAIMVATALSLAWLGPVIAAVQHIVPPNMRATSSAAFLLVNNLLGIGFGIWFIGKLSDLLTPSFGDAALQHAMLYGLGFYLLSSALYFLASSRLSRDWYRGEMKRRDFLIAGRCSRAARLREGEREASSDRISVTTSGSGNDWSSCRGYLLAEIWAGRRRPSRLSLYLCRWPVCGVLRAENSAGW
jgi:hypothetical protein